MAKIFVILCLTVIAVVPWVSASIRCYTCESTSNDLTCLNDPDNVPTGSPITDCQKADCCTILRQEYLETGEVRSFGRGCQRDCPKDGFYKTPDASFITYNTYCSTPVCNTGPGNSKSSGGGGGDDEGGSIDVKGKDGSIANVASKTLSLGLPALILLRL